MFSILFSQIIAPLMALDWPNFTKLTVINVVHEGSEWYDPSPPDDDMIKICGLLPEDYAPYRIPDRTIITVRSKHGRGDITINEETGELMTLGVKRSEVGSGSGDIGIILFGIPGLILTSPILAINHLLWSAWEMMTGMERHVWSIWIRIKDQLDPLTYIIAEKSFLKYKGNDYGKRK